MEHQLVKEEKRYICETCKRAWKTKPVSGCLGVECIDWDLTLPPLKGVGFR